MVWGLGYYSLGMRIGWSGNETKNAARQELTGSLR